MRILLLATVLAASTTHAQPAADTAGIRAAAMDYIEGWYTGDAARMERALHPELAKRIVTTDDKTGRSQLGQMGAMTLVNKTRVGIGTEIPVAQRREDFRILDIYRDDAVAKIVASDWIDYLELARWNGQWKIVNVLWALTPKEDQPR
jgi:hypothetical protein